MRLALSSHNQSCIHVHVVRGQVEGDQPLEDDGPAWESGGKEYEQAGGSATVGDHVENSAEAGGLLEDARSVAIESIKQARDRVEKRASAWVEGHVI